jgi:hypothetical protein
MQRKTDNCGIWLDSSTITYGGANGTTPRSRLQILDPTTGMDRRNRLGRLKKKSP